MSTTPAAVDFSQPVYMDEPAAGSGSSSTASSLDASAVDLNNLSLDQEFDSNADLNAYDAPPPVPDGTYTVKIKQIDVKDASGNLVKFNVKPGKDGKPPYAYCALEGTIQDPSGKYDGLKVYDRFVSTMAQRNGGIPIVRILSCLGVRLPERLTAKILVDQFERALASEPMIKVDTIWEGSLDEADRERFQQANVKQPRVLGMDKFPAGDKGQRTPSKEIDSSLGKVTVTAQVRIHNYHPAK